MAMANACKECAFYYVPESQCRRHAPGTTNEEFEITQWPTVSPKDRCGSGELVTDGSAVVSCGRCLHWHQPGGVGVNPEYDEGIEPEWWAQTGYCTRFAPGPSGEEGRDTYWRVTHRTSACGDGQEPAQKKKVA